MIELIMRLTCERCNTEEEFKEKYKRPYEHEFATKANNFFFRGDHDWRDLPDDIHLCGRCADKYFHIRGKQRKLIDKWMERKTHGL